MIFIDSGAFVARFRKSDDAFTLSQAGWTRLEQTGRRCYTNNLVIAESMDLIANYAGTGVASSFLRSLLESEIHVFRDTAEEDFEATDLMLKYSDQHIGFTDCVSIVQMRRNKIRTVFGFDRHFQFAGFTLWPGPKLKD